jgi:hypothetical protein
MRNWVVLILCSAMTAVAASSVSVLNLPKELFPQQAKLRVGGYRSEGQKIISVSPELKGMDCLTVARGEMTRPGTGYSFSLAAPAVVYLAVMRRGNPSLPEGWVPTPYEIRYRCTTGQHWEQGDSVYVKICGAGKIEIPHHAGRDREHFGLPHMVILDSDIAGARRLFPALGGATTPRPTPGSPPPVAVATVNTPPLPAKTTADRDWPQYNEARKTKLVFQEHLADIKAFTQIVGFIGATARVSDGNTLLKGTMLNLAERRRGLPTTTGAMALRPDLWKKTGTMVLLKDYKAQVEVDELQMFYVAEFRTVDGCPVYEVATEPSFEQWKLLRFRSPSPRTAPAP